MSDEQLDAKFMECATLAIDTEAAERAAAMIAEIESIDDIADLHTALAGDPVASAGRAA
jgi:hypothetical protein